MTSEWQQGGAPHAPVPGPVPRKKSPALKIALAVLGVSVLGCCGLGVVGYGVGRMLDGNQQRMTLAERELLLTAEDLTPYVSGGVTPNPLAETAEKRRHFDGATELFYEYDGVDGPEGLYLSSGVNVDTSASNAGFTYTGLELGASLGLAMEGGQVVQQERDDLLRWGDESRSALLVSEGLPVGNVFVARRGRRIFHVILAGVYFDDPLTFRELIVPHLEAMEGYTP